jgi:hypothetical protein
MNMAWENLKENIKTSAKKSPGLHDLKQHKLRFDEKCLGVLEQRQHVKLQWVEVPSQNNVDNLNTVRHEASNISGTKRKRVRKLKLRNLKLTERSKTLGTCIEATVTLRRFIRLELV